MVKKSRDPKVQEETIIALLWEEFPDGKITHLPNNLRARIFNFARRHNTTSPELIRKWGFKQTYYPTVEDREEELFPLLETAFPDKVIKSLGKYRRIDLLVRVVAKEKGITTKEYLSSIGYTFIRFRQPVYTDEVLINFLKKTYPDGVITSLRLYPREYEAVRRTAIRNQLSVPEQIESWNMTMINSSGRPSFVNPDYMKQRLHDLYPDKRVVRLTSIDKNLYREINDYAKSKETTFKHMVESWGFEYVETRGKAVDAPLTNKEIYNWLTETLLYYYPDRQVHHLSTTCIPAYNCIKNLAKEVELETADILNFLGFSYMETRGRKPISIKPDDDEDESEK